VTGSLDLNGLLDLQREMQDLAGRFVVKDDARFSGADPEGAVTVETDASGTVLRLSLDPQWRECLCDSDLGTAALLAVAAATAERFAASLPSEEPVPGASSMPATAPVDLPAPSGDVSPAEARANIKEMIGLLSAAKGQLKKLNAVLAAQGDRPPVSRTSPDRRVEVTIESGAVTSVHVDPGWAGAAADRQIETTVLEALRSAQSAGNASGSNGTGGNADPQALAAFPELAELNRLTADPSALLRRLGLIG
jgi:DNA-binding protein YbaB